MNIQKKNFNNGQDVILQVTQVQRDPVWVAFKVRWDRDWVIFRVRWDRDWVVFKVRWDRGWVVFKVRWDYVESWFTCMQSHGYMYVQSWITGMQSRGHRYVVMGYMYNEAPSTTKLCIRLWQISFRDPRAERGPWVAVPEVHA